MVNLVKDWKEMEHYASRASYATVRAFQTIEGKDKVTIRVLVGQYGFEQDFKDLKDTQFIEIVKFCGAEKFLDVDKTVPDEQFFK